MSTTVTYKGNTIATVNNNTKTLKTAGKYLEDDVTLVDISGGASAISVIDELDSHGGTIRHINAVDLSNDTVTAAHLEYGYTAHDSQGEAITGTLVPGGGGGTYQAKTGINPSTSSQTITADAGYDALSSVQINAMPSGTAGTPTATKGTVSNHSVAVTPSVTNITGYITGSTKTGTAVTVSASELVSGSQTITSNGTVDVTNLASVIVDVSGGGGGGMQTDEAVGGLSSATTLVFTGLKGEPTSFSTMPDTTVSTGTPAKVAAIVFDGTTLHGQTITNTSNAQVTYDSSSFTKSYSNGTLTITSSGPNFVSGEHYLYYTYGGSSANIDTKDVQVGSGATSITFTGLEDEPDIWSVIFKSNFGTSSGYQRVIFARNNSLGVEGMEMDSMARNALHWTASYNNGSFTVTSNGTNQGGYFHQPGYYQLTYGFGAGSGGGGGSVLVPKTIMENGTYDPADDNADGYSEVTVTVPTGGTPRTSSDLTVSGATVTAPAGTYTTAASKSVASGSATAPATISGTSATVSTGTNTLTLTKTVSVTPSVTAGYVSSGTAGNSSVSLTASVTTQAAQTIHPSTTDQSIAASRYLTGAQTIKAVTHNLDATKILSGTTFKIGDSSDDDCVTSVSGSVTFQTIYSGSSNPSSSTGVNGDIYIKTS